MIRPQIEVAQRVANALDELAVHYVIGGSFASAVHGAICATMDPDILAALPLELAEPLAETFGEAFYADVNMMKEAIRRQGSFNVVHFDTASKIRVFVARQRELDRAQLARRRLMRLSEESEHRACVASAEDIVLVKLEWYRAGGEVSDLQWRDALSVLAVQRDRLDREYLERMANELAVTDLLDRALGELN
jgi:hypothetical protein